LPHPSARGQSERRLAASEIASLELALELHAFSIEETERDKRRAAEAEVAAATKSNVAVSKTTAHAESDDGAYVYDRYVRCSSPSSDVAMRDDMGDELARDAGALGYLVIGSDDEAAWTAYLDGLDGEDADENEILEDDEDSNGKSSPSQPSAEDTSPVWNRRIRWLTWSAAEDYYTNDYPEEEQAASEEDDALDDLSDKSSSFGSDAFDGSYPGSGDENDWVMGGERLGLHAGA
jgi:Transcription factor Iwr1